MDYLSLSTVEKVNSVGALLLSFEGTLRTSRSI